MNPSAGETRIERDAHGKRATYDELTVGTTLG